MKIALLLVTVAGGLLLTGCNAGESTAPKPDPNKFLPAKTENGAKPITPNSPNNPPSSP